MDRKEITAFLINCEKDDFMKFTDLGDEGISAVGPDGKKYRFSIEQLEKGIILREDRLMKMTLNEAAKESAKPSPKPASKPKTATKRQAATKLKPSRSVNPGKTPKFKGNGSS